MHFLREKSQQGKWLFGIRSRAQDLITVALPKDIWGRVITNITRRDWESRVLMSVTLVVHIITFRKHKPR